MCSLFYYFREDSLPSVKVKLFLRFCPLIRLVGTNGDVIAFSGTVSNFLCVPCVFPVLLHTVFCRWTSFIKVFVGLIVLAVLAIFQLSTFLFALFDCLEIVRIFCYVVIAPFLLPSVCRYLFDLLSKFEPSHQYYPGRCAQS